MRPVLVVMGHVGVQHGSQFFGRADLIDVDPFILQSTEEPLRSGIVQALALAVHADPDFMFLQQGNIVRVGEVPPRYRFAERSIVYRKVIQPGVLPFRVVIFHKKGEANNRLK